MKLRDANLQVNDKNSSQILLHVFCLHFLRTHHGYFEEPFKVCEQNFFQKIRAKGSVTCNLPVELRFI